MVQYVASDRSVVAEAMRNLFEALYRFIATTWFRVFFNSKNNDKHSNLFIVFISRIILSAWTIFAIYNLYTLVATGLVFRFGSRRGFKWISYAENPSDFVVCGVVYGFTVLFMTLIVVAPLLAKREHKRAAFRQLADGNGPPPIARPWDGSQDP